MVEHISALIALYGKHGEIEDGNTVEDPEKVRLIVFFYKLNAVFLNCFFSELYNSV